MSSLSAVILLGLTANSTNKYKEIAMLAKYNMLLFCMDG